MQDDLAEQESRRAVLTGEEADRRKVALIRLQDALAARGVESVIVGRHALTLRGFGPAPPSRPGDPELHVRARIGAASSPQMGGISVSQIAACIPPLTRTEQQGASWGLTHARTLPGARHSRRRIRDLADVTALFSERVSALCGGFAMTA